MGRHDAVVLGEEPLVQTSTLAVDERHRRTDLDDAEFLHLVADPRIDQTLVYEPGLAVRRAWDDLPIMDAVLLRLSHACPPVTRGVDPGSVAEHLAHRRVHPGL